jgi:large subunit ribosomal protein L18
MGRLDSNIIRLRIHERIRKKVSGDGERPRLCVFRSNKHIYAQIVDDAKGQTLAAASSRDEETRGAVKNGGNIAAAKAVGKTVAKRAIDKGIQSVLFDRGGYIYHGRVKALAEAAREAGLKF